MSDQRRYVLPTEHLGFDALTRREMQVLRLYPTHPFRKLIAYEMGIKVSTVREHSRNILQKLDCATLGQAAVLFDRWVRGHHES